jgi:hypothetical protein
MAYRDDLDALEARKATLEVEVKQKTLERDQVSYLLDEARNRAKLPVLDNIRIASPCSADWNQMIGDERVRHCGKCDKDVFNISTMTRDEAEQLVRDKHGDLCARYYQRKDGTILLSDCTIGKSQQRKRRWIAAGAAALLAGTSVAAHELTKDDEHDRRDHEMGQTLGGAVSFNPHEDHAVAGGVSFDPPPPPVVEDNLEVVKGKISIDQRTK